MNRPKFLIARYIYPRVFAELSKELKRHIPECPFTAEEIGYVTLVLVREEIIFFNPRSKHYSLPDFNALDSIAVQNFILRSKKKLTELYVARRKNITK